METAKQGATGGRVLLEESGWGREERSAGKAPSPPGAASSSLSPNSEDASSGKPSLTAQAELVCSLP